MHQSYRAKCIHVFPSITSRIYMTFSSVILQTSYLYINTRYQNSYTETMYLLVYSSLCSGYLH